MNVENLLQAAIELDKRIATDQLLRQYFSAVWGKRSVQVQSAPAPSDISEAGNLRDITFSFPREMCELLEIGASATGKTPAQLLEESFAEYCARNIGKWKVGP